MYWRPPFIPRMPYYCIFLNYSRAILHVTGIAITQHTGGKSYMCGVDCAYMVDNYVGILFRHLSDHTKVLFMECILTFQQFSRVSFDVFPMSSFEPPPAQNAASKKLSAQRHWFPSQRMIFSLFCKLERGPLGTFSGSWWRSQWHSGCRSPYPLGASCASLSGFQGLFAVSSIFLVSIHGSLLIYFLWLFMGSWRL